MDDLSSLKMAVDQILKVYDAVATGETQGGGGSFYGDGKGTLSHVSIPVGKLEDLAMAVGRQVHGRERKDRVG